MAVMLVFCTCPDRASARALAEMLVERRLAACVNLLPGVESVYRWHGAIERTEEVLALIKTTEGRLDALQAAILERHPYELPEILAVKSAAGLKRYLAWVAEQTRETST